MTHNWKVPKICSDANINPSFKTNGEKRIAYFKCHLRVARPDTDVKNFTFMPLNVRIL